MGYHIPRPAEESLIRRAAVRIVKEKPGIYGIPQVDFDADFYCEKMNDSAFCYETENEFVLYVEHLILKDACLVTGSYAEDERWGTAAVICENQRLLFNREGGKVMFTFEISGLTGLTRTLQIHSTIREPGLTLRVEQNDEGRRAGKYREGEYPATQAKAALNYEFAMRELLKRTGICEYLSRSGLGYLLLLGFETNNEVHGDWPPHWHLIFRWPNHCGSQAPHIYLDEAGRITHNLMCIDKIPQVSHTYAKGDWCDMVDMYGRRVLRLRVDDDGGMSVTRADGSDAIYKMSAYRDDGIILYEGQKKIGTVLVNNDTGRGILRVHKNFSGNQQYEEVECITYDNLTGTIRSHTREAGDRP